MKKKLFTLLTLFVLCVIGASASTSVPTKDTQIACKSFVQTTLLWTSSTNFATWYAEGWATSGKSSNWADINSTTNKNYQINPETDEPCSATEVSGIGVKDDSDSKQLFLYVTNVTKIEAYFINSTGKEARTAKVNVIGSGGGESSASADANASVKVTSNGLTASEKYLVQFNASADMVLYAVRFTAASASANVSVEIPSSGYATFSSANALDLNTVNAYIVSAVSSTSATLSAVTEAPANTGIIIQGTPGDVVNIPVKASAEGVGTNKLYATVKPKTVVVNEAYILSGGKFHPANAGTIPAGKAYLDATDVAGAHELSLDFGNVTAINKVETTKQASSEYYNLAGQQVTQPTKGLYIVNGKKVIIK